MTKRIQFDSPSQILNQPLDEFQKEALKQEIRRQSKLAAESDAQNEDVKFWEKMTDEVWEEIEATGLE